MLATTLATALTLFSLVSAQGSDAPPLNVCSKDKFPDTFKVGFTVPIVQVAVAQTLNNANPLTCRGTFVFVDGCTFMIKNFTFLNAYESKWYAGVVGTVNGKVVANQNAITFVEQSVSASDGRDVTFNLISSPATAYSFFSINQLRLFDLTQKQLICTVDLPYQNPNNPGSNPAAAGGAPGAAASSGAIAPVATGSGAASGSNNNSNNTSTPAKSGASQLVASLGAVFAAALFL
ncbi:hypothetical protein BJ741DRAFT_613671 [Chytriomyces cf. hyalinus JEL632]|nr:hypothetical protein BJ741DRAFT_613671 [Chytriomyces cf. hyalinus JEL632]